MMNNRRRSAFLRRNQGVPFNPQFNLLNVYETAINVSMRGALLGSDGKVYVGPHNRNEINIIDSSDNVLRVPLSSLGSTARWGCGIVEHGDHVYVAPHNRGQFTKMHKSTLAISNVGPAIGGTFKFYDVVKNLIDSCFYCVPNNTGRVLKFNPVTETGGLIGPSYGANQFNNGIYMPNGKIYFSPNNRAFFHEFDPVTETGLDFGTDFLATANKFGRMEIIDDTHFLCSPLGIRHYCIVDIVSKTTTLWGTNKPRTIGGIAKLENGKYYTMASQNPIGSWEVDLSLSDDVFISAPVGGTFINGAVQRGGRAIYGAPSASSANGVYKFSI